MVRHVYVGRRPRWYDAIPFNPLLLAIPALLLVLAVGGIASCVAQSAASGEDPSGVDAAASDAGSSDSPSPGTENPGPDASGVPLASSTLPLDSALADGAWPGGEVFSFSGTDHTTQTVYPEQAGGLYQAIRAIDQAGCGVGFVLLDLQTGRGLGYNADISFFSASTIKAPYATFVSQALIDGGKASRDDRLEEEDVMEGTGIMADDGVSSYSLATVLKNTIVYSDNTGYAMLRETYGGAGWNGWIASAGIEADEVDGEWYPYYSARTLLKFWIATAGYLQVQTQAAQDLAASLSHTETSFVRSALGSGATVLSKPGFEVDSDTFDMAALNEGGIVQTGTGSYLVAVMSDIGYDSDNLRDNGHLIEDVFSALDTSRSQLLAPAPGAGAGS